MIDKGKIPPPTPSDLSISLLGQWLSAQAHADYSSAHYREHEHFYVIIEALVRRCHATETERDQLRATLAAFQQTNAGELVLENARLKTERDAALRARDMAHVVARDSNAKLADAARRIQERAARVADEWAAFCREGRVVQGDLARNFYGGGLEASEKIAAAIRSLTPATTEPPQGER